MVKRRREIEEKLAELRDEDVRAQVQLQSVLRREPTVSRVVNEMREIRERDHFTELFIDVVGGHK